MLAPFAPAALAVALLTARWARTGHWGFHFLVWNLFLAAVPFGLALLAERYELRRLAILPLVSAWLVFFPNAPYLMTDFVHLRERLPVPLWYDIGLLGAASLAGFVLGIASLSSVHGLVDRQLGKLAGWSFVVVASIAAGFGIWLGRFGRWNSWDLLLNPRGVLSATADALTVPLGYNRAFGVTAVFAALFAATYVALSRQLQVSNIGSNSDAQRRAVSKSCTTGEPI
jgi:uncharacterized membrane protein